MLDVCVQVRLAPDAQNGVLIFLLLIENDASLEQPLRVFAAIEPSLAALRRRVEPANRALFQAMAEDYVSDILRVRRDIDAYVGTASAMQDGKFSCPADQIM